MSHGLNPPQLAAVNALRGPLLVLAGAGTGKTRVVTYRIANLIRHGVAPDRILAVTFTNKAAAEMQERVGSLLGKRQPKRPQISTFHSHCVRVLRRHIRRLGYPERFAIFDAGDQESLARSVLREIRVPTEVLRPADLLWRIGQWKTRSVRPPAAAAEAASDKEHFAALGYRRYQRALKNQGAVDFDDLLLLTEDLLGEHDDVRAAEAGLFDHVLIDEYQDTNRSQYRIVKHLTAGHRNLCVVGDDDQSIYAWRGAEVDHILNFRRDWPDAQVVNLVENYRSTAAILELANRLIAQNVKRHDKSLVAARRGGEQPKILQFATEEEEARGVAGDIALWLSRPGVEPREFAILFRTNEQPRAFEAELRRRKLPYVLIGGQSFFDRREVRDILAYLRLIENPHDEPSLLRIINRPARGIGQRAIETLMGAAVERGSHVWDVMRSSAGELPLPQATRAALDAFRALVGEFQQRLSAGRREPLAGAARALVERIGYREELQRTYTDQAEFETRWGAVEQVVNAIAAYEREENEQRPTLAGFLDSATLGERDFDDDKEKQLRANAIALMTLHAAKGLEFPHVYMVGLEEGLLPHRRSTGDESGAEDEAAIAEERRLCYVGMTRAQDRLTLTLALTRLKWGKPRESEPSRFLYEITGRPRPPRKLKSSGRARQGRRR